MIDLRINVAQFEKDIDRTVQQHAKALANALNWTAFDARAELQDQIASTFDEPTPWAKRSVYVQQATANDPSAKVDMARGRGKINKSWAYEYGLFSPHVYGVDRGFKRTEVLLWQRGILPDGMNIVPAAGARLNAFGNMTSASVTKVLSDIRAHDERGFLMNNRHHLSGFQRTVRRDKKTGRYSKIKRAERSKNKAKHFIKYDAAGKPVGVWKRTGPRGSRSVIPVWHFIKRAKYKSVFNFFETVERVRDAKFKDAYRRALLRELSR